MRFALTHPLLTHPHEPELTTGPGVVALARTAEEVGFDAYGFTDHPAPPTRWLEAGGHDALDPFVALGFVAAATTRLRLLPNLVVLPYRHPLIVAKAGATLDVLSNGRFTLCVGAGHVRGEFRSLGIDPDERGPRLEEALEVIRAVWSGDRVEHEGRFFGVRDISPRPLPVTDPHPPIWVGGNSAAARRRAAALGDGWAPFPADPALAGGSSTATLDTVELLEEAVGDLRRRLEALGRDPDAIDIAFMCRAGGEPGDDDFDPGAHLAGLEELARIGVTWLQVPVPGDSVARADEAIRRYAETVVEPFRGSR